MKGLERQQLIPVFARYQSSANEASPGLCAISIIGKRSIARPCSSFRARKHAEEFLYGGGRNGSHRHVLVYMRAVAHTNQRGCDARSRAHELDGALSIGAQSFQSLTDERWKVLRQLRLKHRRAAHTGDT